MGKIQDLGKTKTGKKIREKGRKGIFYAVFGRSAVIILLVLIQIIILFLFFFRMQIYAYAYWAFSLITAAAVICIVNRSGNPDYKMAWMIPITIMPVFGVLLYLFVELNIDHRVLNRRLSQLGTASREYMAQDEETLRRLQKDDVRSASLARYLLQNGYPVYRNTQAQYFPLGKDKYRALVEKLEDAREFIFMEYFIVEEGQMWGHIHEILKRKAAEGVEVRFMYDGTNTVYRLPHSYPKRLEAEGIHCRVFNRIRPVLSTVQNNRDHRKIAVIDGHTAFTGGVNLADEYIGATERFGVWKDTAVMICGEAVRSFTDMFLQMWNITERSEDYARYLLPRPAAGYSGGYVIPYADSPLDGEAVGAQVYMDILNTATDYVHIMTPYLVLDDNMMDSLTYAAKRGVDVRIIMPGIPDKRYAFTLAKTYYEELLQAGVRIYQFTPGFVHAKEFVSDGRKAVVGTINMDYRSLFLHFECAVYFYRMPVVHDIEADFRKTLEECREVTWEMCRREKITTRITGQLLRLIAPLM